MINTGYVGIGSASPDAPLYIDGSVYSSPYGGLRVVGAGSGAGTSNVDLIADFGIGTSGSVSGVWLGGRSDETTGVIGAKTASGNLAFEVYQSGWKERMRINNNGNVGIGTTTPGRKLDINGAGSGDVVGIKGGSYNQVNIAHSTNSTWGLLLSNSDATSNTGYHYSSSGENTSVAIVNVNNDAMHFGTNNNQVMSINHSGNVSIGVNNTSYGKLDVYREPATGWTRSVTRNNAASAFVGVYKTTSPNTTNSPGIFAHSGAVNAWADLWINAHDNGSGGVAGGTSQSIFMAGNVGINTKPVNNTLQVSGGADRAAISVTNADLGNVHYSDKNNRYLTSNGVGWTSGVDGVDPGIVIAGYNATSDIKQLGLVLHNDTSTNNAYSPSISFGAVSASGAYNTSYAHIIGKRKGTADDSNWASGSLHFFTQPDNEYVNSQPSMLIHHGGQIEGSMNGRHFNLNSNGWFTFGRLYSAQSTPLHFKVLTGHNSYGNYGEFTNDTYAYNIAVGTTVTVGSTSGNGVTIRKIKRVGGDYSGGDGGWEYQISRTQSLGTGIRMHIMGVTDAWTWIL
jgi:hypothetical protein